MDGTLFKQGKNVPKSTIRAIAKIRENGHLAFVCTGRSRVMVPKTPILDIGFDGVVAACGMYADYQGKLLFAEEMRQEVLDDILPVLQRTETMYILEGTEYIYYDENTIGNAIDDWYIDAIRTMIPGHFIPVPKDSCKIRASKVSIQVPPQRAHEVIEAAKRISRFCCTMTILGRLSQRGIRKHPGSDVSVSFWELTVQILLQWETVSMMWICCSSQAAVLQWEMRQNRRKKSQTM